jgi:hypothetical protein
MRSSLLASVVVTEFHTTEAYSSLDLINVQYNIYKEPRQEKGKVIYSPNKTKLLDTLRKYVVDMIMEMQFRINKHTQVFNRVGTGYGGMTKFVLEE